jgi:hypothetical protein
MNKDHLIPAMFVVVIGVAAIALLATDRTSAQPTLQATANDLRSVADFAGVVDERARAIALFQEAGKVLQHPRCVNCHPAGDSPLQTDRMRQHEPMVVRGVDGQGVASLPCNTCHGPSNFDPARVPGDPHWHLAPLSMAWEGRSLAQICEQIKDRTRNGQRDIAELLHHLGEDTLVGWAWFPGEGRAPAPGTWARFGQIMRAWADAGAHCPTS